MQRTGNSESKKAHEQEFPEQTVSDNGSVHIRRVPAAF